MFSFGGKDDDTKDEHATTPGAANAAPNSGGVSDHLTSAARENAEQELVARPRRKYTKRTDNRAGESDQPALQAKVDAAILAQLEACYDPRAWGAVVTAPADCALALTGRDHWNVSPEERATLGATASAAARTMMITNPKSLAFFMFGVTLTSFYLPRLVAEMKAWRKAKEEKENANDPNKTA